MPVWNCGITQFRLNTGMVGRSRILQLEIYLRIGIHVS